MLRQVILVALVATAALAEHHHHHEHRDHPKITCSGVTPVKNVEFDKLSGNWVAVETLAFKDGHPFTPENDRRHTICGYAKGSDASESGLTVTLELHEPGKDLRKEVLKATTIDAETKGRMSFTSDINDRTNWEFLLLDYDHAKYLVYLLCQPPNADGDRLPERAVLYSRHADHSDHEVTSHDEEHKIETRIGEMLHLDKTDDKPVRLSTSCWASYAEPSA